MVATARINKIASRLVAARHLLIAALALAWLAVGAAAQAEPLRAGAYKMAGDATKMRIAMEFDREPQFRWFLLRGPHRLVIDLQETEFRFDHKELKARGLVKAVQFGDVGDDTSRLILTGKGPFNVENVDVAEMPGGAGYRLTADIVAGSEREFDAALALQADTTGSTRATAKGDRVGAGGALRDERFTVVIDAGHGGIDGGAEGLNGTVEKTITLAFALELATKLRENKGYDVYLTRETDEFLRLDDRVRIARQHDADLFISIHADTIRLKGVRGATVYTVSDQASDAEAEALADRENLSDKLAGIEIDETDHEVSDILIDLIRRETHSFSIRFARSLVGELSNQVEMINNPHRFAGFRVLKAPDVPSVLVELGYLSNPKDEEQLRNAEWRGRAVDSIAKSVSAFAVAKTGTGG